VDTQEEIRDMQSWPRQIMDEYLASPNDTYGLLCEIAMAVRVPSEGTVECDMFSDLENEISDDNSQKIYEFCNRYDLLNRLRREIRRDEKRSEDDLKKIVHNDFIKGLMMWALGFSYNDTLNVYSYSSF